jgi:hypothetical protein
MRADPEVRDPPQRLPPIAPAGHENVDPRTMLENRIHPANLAAPATASISTFALRRPAA